MDLLIRHFLDPSPQHGSYGDNHQDEEHIEACADILHGTLGGCHASSRHFLNGAVCPVRQDIGDGDYQQEADDDKQRLFQARRVGEQVFKCEQQAGDHCDSQQDVHDDKHPV